MWAQRSRLLWARQGDKNSKYFHSCATKRYRKNLIEGIRDEGGLWKTNMEEITEVLVSYYHSLFTSKGHVDASRVLEYVPNVITDEMNALLSRKFEVHEVERALHQMAPLKAPGPDGMPPLFYQHFWGTVRHDVTSSILLWLNSLDILIDPRSRQWNVDMVDGLFNTEEAEIVKSIPLSQEAVEDILFWPYSCDGRYNCKTGYRFLKEEEELTVELREIKNKNQLELFAITVWTIWNQRNRVRVNQPADALHQLAHLSKVWLEDYCGRLFSPDTQVLQVHRLENRWRPPPSEFYKINFDGAVFPREKKTGVGVVIRDHRGQVIASSSKLVHQQLCSNGIEALAAGCDLSFALDVGVKRAILEGDSLSVIKGLMEEERMLVPLGLLIKDAKRLSHNFDEFCYSHTKRECNALAHNLARYAVSIPDFLVWMEEVPSQFQYVLQADSVGLFQ
ncbi:uncharacterized protein LOC136063873 [Quercus suber]|uniref:uncharacterized protein LOC136063873 n=1 Tax=Quercus suber TaxID=58331 RepID=UPI0032DFE0FC